MSIAVFSLNPNVGACGQSYFHFKYRATEWDSILPFVHKSLYLAGRGLPVWPMSVNVEHAAT